MLGVASVLALIFGNLVTGVFVLFVALAAVNGYWVGASRITAVFGGMFVAAILAVPLGRAFEGVFSAALGSSGLTNRMVSIAMLALIIVVVVTIALQVVIGRVVKKKPQWKRYDKLIGSGLGLAEGTLLGFLLIWAVLSLEPIAVTSLAQTGEPQNATRPNPVSQKIVALAKVARESSVGQIADAVNPLDEMRLITMFENGLIVLNDPAIREAFVTHPTIEGLRQRPAVQQALEMLAADPKINQIIESEGSISGEELRAILDSPTILDILDETNLVGELSPIVEEIERAIEQAVANPALAGGLAEIYPDADEAVWTLLEGLNDPEPQRRMRAANTLGDFGPGAAAAIPALIDALDDEVAPVRSAVARALGEIGWKASAAMPALRRALQDTDASVRQAATDALGKIDADGVNSKG